MAVSNIKAEFKVPLERVWAVVTSLESYGWRSDLEKIEVLENGSKFIEYSHGGFATEFTITEKEPMKKYSFSIKNSNIEGIWTGIFKETDSGTFIDFTENLTPKKVLMRPFAGFYLKMQQKKYVADLKKYLES